MYSYLESWFGKPTNKRPQSQKFTSYTAQRANSEADLAEGNEVIQIQNMSEKEINAKLEVLINDMNLSEERKAPLRKMDVEQKRKMLEMSLKGAFQESGSKFDRPEEYMNYLSNYSKPDNLQLNKLISCVESLKISVTNNTLSWVEEFGKQGMMKVIQILELAIKQKDVKLQTECLKCLEKLMNNTNGMKWFFHAEKALEKVASCLDYKSPALMIQAIKILAAFCFVNIENEEGLDKVLSAVTAVAENNNTERFLPIVYGITKSNNADLQSMCFQFINAMLSETDDFEFRMHLRNEIVRNGLNEKLHELKNETNPVILRHFEIFERDKDADADELHERFDKVSFDMDDMTECFEVLKNMTMDTPAEPYFLSILQHLLFIRDDFYVRPAYFKIIEECVTQIVLHKSGLDPDFKRNHVDIDLQPLIDELKKESPKEEDNAKIAELKKQLEEAQTAKMEAETKLELVRNGTLPPSSGKLNPELINKVVLPGMGPPPPPMPGSGGPPPPPLPGMGGPPPPPLPGMGGPPPPPMPGMGGPPPPPLPGMGPPPPPPPGMGPSPPMMMGPKPPQPETLPFGLKPKKKWEVKGMKKANWKTIAAQKLSEKSFWVKVKEEELAHQDILDSLAKKFSSKPTKAAEDTTDKSSMCGTLKKVKEMKVLDGKSAQNILILLNGSLKHMDYDFIKKCLLQCDLEVLNENVLQQLIQYLPPQDQLNKLMEYKDSYKDLTEAEQFCIKMAEVKRLLPRLKSLSFKHHYAEMINDTKPGIVAATSACEEVQKSKKFAKILELILLLGNYMNSGSRNAGAFGFEMSFLTKLNGTKDVNNKQTLLQYIAETVEKKWPELLNFYDEMSHIDQASRVSVETIQKTLNQMDSHIKNLRMDLDNNKTPQGPDDRFSAVMEQFAIEARSQCDLIKNMFKKMERLYSDLAEYYAFDKQKYNLEEFFTDLRTFKDSFIEAHKENLKERELEDKREKARLAKEQQEKDKKLREASKKRLIDMNPSETQEGVMDSLLEALSSGSAFGREQKRRRGPRPAGAERRANLMRSRSRQGLLRELTNEIVT